MKQKNSPSLTELPDDIRILVEYFDCMRGGRLIELEIDGKKFAVLEYGERQQCRLVFDSCL